MMNTDTTRARFEFKTSNAFVHEFGREKRTQEIKRSRSKEFKLKKINKYKLQHLDR